MYVWYFVRFIAMCASLCAVWEVLEHFRWERFRNPFCYPKVRYIVDIRDNGSSSYRSYIDEWVNQYDPDLVSDFEDMLSAWDRQCKDYINRSLFGRRRKYKLYQDMRSKIVDDTYDAFEFAIMNCHRKYEHYGNKEYSYVIQKIETVVDLSFLDLKGVKVIEV